MAKTYFLSDIHLGARYIEDALAHERKVVEMLEYLGKDAEHIYMLGDVLDYWFEYKTVVPRGYIRFFGVLARLADAGVKITWVIGNHDIWLFDYLREQIGMEVVDGAIVREIYGKTFYIAHGDNLGRLNKRSFRLIRGLFRNRFCQKLYSGLHPRWTVPFAMRWSSGSRKKNATLAEWHGDDSEPVMIFTKNYIETIDSSINYFVMGHRHLVIERELTADCKLVITGECISQFSYAQWDGEKLEIKHFDGN